MAEARRFVRKVVTRPRRRRSQEASESQEAASRIDIWGLGVSQIRRLVLDSDDVVFLGTLLSAERDNPSFIGGRKSALEAIQRRIDDLRQ